MRGKVVLAATPIGNTADVSRRLAALIENADAVLRTPAGCMIWLTVWGVLAGQVAYYDHN